MTLYHLYLENRDLPNNLDMGLKPLSCEWVKDYPSAEADGNNLKCSVLLKLSGQ